MLVLYLLVYELSAASMYFASKQRALFTLSLGFLWILVAIHFIKFLLCNVHFPVQTINKYVVFRTLLNFITLHFTHDSFNLI